MLKNVLVPIADGTEEIEAVCIIDVLRRAGASVTVASVYQIQVTASRGVKIVADKLIADCSDNTYDMIVLPGGKVGAEHMRDSEELVRLLKIQQQEDRYYAAICASPAIVFQHHGLLESRKATSYPDFIKHIPNAVFGGPDVVVDGNCITSKGPGTALLFAVKLVELLFGKDKADEVSRALLLS